MNARSSCGKGRLAWAPLVLLVWLALWPGCAQAQLKYEFGRGLDVGPFNLAGYSSLSVGLQSDGHRFLSLEDLSLFASGHVTPLVNPFVEAELTRLNIAPFAATDEGRGGDGDLVLERFYNDSYLSDNFTLRVGKMLAPVGEWNQTHAAPLVLTTLRPAVTYRNFSEYATGLSLSYTDLTRGNPDIQLYVQPAGELSERSSRLTTHQYRAVEGAHVSFPVGLLDKSGFSYQQSRDTSGVDQSLFGFDFRYTLDRLSLQGEGSFSDVSGRGAARSRDIEWGFYGAASYLLDDHWLVYSWYEAFADRAASSTAQDILLGVSYRPLPPIVLKLEYLQNVGGAPVNPTGLFGSIAVLF